MKQHNSVYIDLVHRALPAFEQNKFKMADLIWCCSSTFSNNKKSHHDSSGIVKDYPCVSQLRNFFQTFHYFSIFRCMATPRQKNEIWILLITHNNVTS